MIAEQSKMARAAVGWGVRDLAAAAKVSTDTIVRLERGEALKERTVEAIRAALEKAGVEFIPENGGGAGVRLAKRKTRKPGRAFQAIAAGLKDAIADVRGERGRVVRVHRPVAKAKRRK